MSRVRAAAVAGQFYAGQSAPLQSNVDAMLAAARSSAPCPKVIVAPHAGYIYSGPVAAEVYARLGNAEQPLSRVVLLGPSHRVAFRGIATCSAEYWETPLGRIALDRPALDSISGMSGVCVLDDAHAREHSLEVHLPFLQRSIAGFSLVPLVVGDAPAADVAAVIRSLWGSRETLIVISSDLSHYLPYQQALAKDLATARMIESGIAELTGDQACGCRPLNGLLMLLAERGMALERVDLRNSGDTAGNRDRVVGYGAWVAMEKCRDESQG